MKSPLKSLVLAVAASSALLLGGCASHAAQASQEVIAAAENGRFDVDALMFAQGMIPHHQQAVELADLALANSTNPEVLAIAQEIKAAQEPEIAQMRAWLSEVGLSEGESHAGHMSGMLSDEQMAALAAATGSEFDRLFLEGMIEHHRGAIEMAQEVVESAVAEVSTLAAAVIAAQTAEIAEMELLLEALAG